ncbi:glucose and ribitol dehydrogenase-like isoform X2 [Andrographis paniculata]|uniref:glucose and ribitol dehydrogenase-like isoform X2 n=1 Tax=Andrographis paniculata TaxID=175694 RepID=UPI0021E80B28|nr:glucose and ribitol dehydrogenase-like isoform X2 [Andrographis paniculata]
MAEVQPQKQEVQPGKQQLMNPPPQSISPHYKQSNKLYGKVALVTGGDSGIGQSVCYHFAMEGATVAFTFVPGYEDEDAKNTLRKINQLKAPGAGDPLAVPADVGFEENCRMVVEKVAGKYGRIDILVNNAAEQHLSLSVEDIDEDRLLRVFRTNIFSYFFFIRHALKHMKEGSTIINSTSAAAYCGSSALLDYCATKGAIVALTRGLALNLAEKGIRVNAVAAGPVWTALQVASKPEEMVAEIGAETPMGRAAQPHEIAPSYVFLASNDSSSYFTGQVVHPNVLRRRKYLHDTYMAHRRIWLTEGHVWDDCQCIILLNSRYVLGQ